MKTDVVDGIEGVLSSFPAWGGVFLIFLILIILGLCIYRARSFDFLLDRIWVFFGGNKEFKDPIMNKEWDVVKDLELYRYRYGFSADSMEDVVATRLWINENKININDLRRINNLFDFKKFEIKGTTFYFEMCVLAVFATFLLVFTYTSLVASFTADPYFRVVETDYKFKFDGNKITMKDKTLKASDCLRLKNASYPDVNSQKNSYNEYIACSIFDEDGKKLYKETRSEQKVLGFIGAIIFMIAFPVIIRKSKTYDLARKIKKTLADSKK